MKVKVNGVATIRISVTDVKQSTAWYQKLFDCCPTHESENFASFQMAGICLDIVRADDKSPVSKGGSVGYWSVDSFDQALLHATALGAKVYRGPLKVPEINRIIAQMEDPFGNVTGFEGRSSFFCPLSSACC